MQLNRRAVLKGIGGTLALPLLESAATAAETNPPLRLLVVGNPFGAHPDHFFPKQFGKRFETSPTLKSLDWLKDRMTILSHTDHGMKSGHGRELAYLSGVLPETSHAYPEKNMSVDQVIARQIGSRVRFASLNATLERSIRLSWNANGVDIKPFTNVDSMYDHLFLNLSEKQKRQRRELMNSNQSILDAVRDQLNGVRRLGSAGDKQRLDQFAQSVRDLESSFELRKKWIGRDKPGFDLSPYEDAKIPIEGQYNAIFDMVAYAFETDLTRVATIGFSPELSYRELDGVNRGYHGCTHNGKNEDVVDELVTIESFQVAQLARCLERLDSINEPNSEGTMLDHTVVLFGSGMGYGGTHSNRNLPILIAGGGFKHLGHVDSRNSAGENMPLCNLFVTLLQRFGIERDSFNTSTGAFDIQYS